MTTIFDIKDNLEVDRDIFELTSKLKLLGNNKKTEGKQMVLKLIPSMISLKYDSNTIAKPTVYIMCDNQEIVGIEYRKNSSDRSGVIYRWYNNILSKYNKGQDNIKCNIFYINADFQTIFNFMTYLENKKTDLSDEDKFVLCRLFEVDCGDVDFQDLTKTLVDMLINQEYSSLGNATCTLNHRYIQKQIKNKEGMDKCVDKHVYIVPQNLIASYTQQTKNLIVRLAKIYDMSTNVLMTEINNYCQSIIKKNSVKKCLESYEQTVKVRGREINVIFKVSGVIFTDNEIVLIRDNTTDNSQIFIFEDEITT